MKPHDLIGQARRLIAASPRRPRQVDLRRAISAAYYALFHAIARTSANILVGTSHADSTSAAWRQVYRSLDHNFAKEQCKKLPQTYSQELRDVAAAFIVLQELRHSADYDPGATFLLGDVESHIVLAESVLEKLAAATKPEQRAFVVWILLKTRK